MSIFRIAAPAALIVIMASFLARTSAAVELDLHGQQTHDVEAYATTQGGLEIWIDQSPLLNTGFPSWAKDFHWVGSRIGLTPQDAERSEIAGNLGRLDVKIAGAVFKAQPNQLVYRWTLTAGTPFDGIIGGGPEFSISAETANAVGLTTKPTLLPDNKGWQWSLNNGQEIRVEFDPALPKLYFERHNPYQIRAFLVGSTVVPGVKTYTMTVTVPKGGTVSPAPPLAATGTADWYRNVLVNDASPVDVSFLNDAPAGKHGFAVADGDSIRFSDGTPVRFWGATLAAYALYQPTDVIDKQCERIAALGFNLVRIHHQDSMGWVAQTVIDKTRNDSQHLDEKTLDRLDYWISCLKKHGVYVWLDLHVGRLLKPGDDVPGFAEISARFNNDPKGAELKGYNYFNSRIEELMRDMNAKYLGHVNKYTGLAYKDDPAVLAVLLTNEDDLPAHFGNLMLPDKHNPYHNAIFDKAVRDFAAKYGLPYDPTWRTWIPGPSKLFLADREAEWDMRMSAHLRSIGVRSLIATTQLFGRTDLSALPAPTTGDLITVNSYGSTGFLAKNPRFVANFLDQMGMGQLADKPLGVTEWNVPAPARDRFMAPLYLASVASLQGWSALMLYNYSQSPFGKQPGIDPMSTYSDLAYTGVMPAAALLYRRGDVAEGRKHYVLSLEPHQPYYTSLGPSNLTTLRTLLEQSRVSVALPAVKENPWLKPTKIPADAIIVKETGHDFLPPAATSVASDTGELKRDWTKGLQTIDTARSQAVNGHVCGGAIALSNATFDLDTCYAVVDIASLDDAPLKSARRVLITAVARVVKEGPNVLSEPVKGTITFHGAPGGVLYALDGHGDKTKVDAVDYRDGAYRLSLPIKGGTHWFLLESKG